jgi:hypothetical protein
MIESAVVAAMIGDADSAERRGRAAMGSHRRRAALPTSERPRQSWPATWLASDHRPWVAMTIPRNPRRLKANDRIELARRESAMVERLWVNGRDI